MIIGLEIGMLIAGIMALAKGKFQLSKTRVVDGAAARIIGVIFLLPLPVALFIGVLVGISEAKQGRQVTIDKYDTKWVLLEAGMVIGVFLVGILIASLTSHAPREKRRYHDDDFDEDEEDIPVKMINEPRQEKPVSSTSIVAHCPGCRQSFSLHASLYGKKVRCKACSEVFRVDAPYQAADDAILIAEVVAKPPTRERSTPKGESLDEPIVPEFVEDEGENRPRHYRRRP